MNSSNMITKHPALLQILCLSLGAISGVAALVWLVVFLLKLTAEGLGLIISFIQQSNALLESVPALHFLAMLGLACIVVVLSTRLIFWTIRNVRVEVLYHGIV